jgi:hypothetical protein
MRRLRWTAVSGVALLGLLLGSSGGPAHGQAPADTGAAKSSAELGRPSKSVRGKLETVDAPVIAELAKYKPGDPMIVIYRQTASNEKRVTAVAFPGTAEKPTYLNMTGYRILMRSSPARDGLCGAPDQPATESLVPNGGLAEALDACWCCAQDGETCSPGNRTGAGKAVLVSCFK